MKEDHEDATHHVSGDMDKNPALLVAQVCNVLRAPGTGGPGLFLN